MKINKNLNIQTENLHGEKIIIIDDFIEEFSNIHEMFLHLISQEILLSTNNQRFLQDNHHASLRQKIKIDF